MVLEQPYILVIKARKALEDQLKTGSCETNLIQDIIHYAGWLERRVLEIRQGSIKPENRESLRKTLGLYFGYIEIDELQEKDKLKVLESMIPNDNLADGLEGFAKCLRAYDYLPRKDLEEVIKFCGNSYVGIRDLKRTSLIMPSPFYTKK